MIRRLALTAVLAVLSVMALAPKAQAQLAEEEAVPFIGSVGSVCTFDGTVGGTLAVDNNGDISTFTDDGGGEAGTTTVNCTGGGDITVAPPQVVEVPNGFTGTSTATVSDPQDPEQNFVDSNGNGNLEVPAAAFDLDVDMAVVPDEDPIPGTYEYEVVVTATATE